MDEIEKAHETLDELCVPKTTDSVLAMKAGMEVRELTLSERIRWIDNHRESFRECLGSVLESNKLYTDHLKQIRK